ncbi:DUF668 family protein [Quillaja saponaria]|uniref:DUF668 family protein n=2 Tax=Quillaja saponaria TaxID=32244 RepID=A0AAD7LGS1_QUISA|nr:DUF668 family protein [Quillaja saponaria]
MSKINTNSGFFSGMASRGNKISILSFEVANTITKGANLFQSLSEENIQSLKKGILQSEGVKELVSTDMTKLLSFAAADKREVFEVFSREVARFGDLCKDPQWHNLDRYFSRLDSDASSYKQLKVEAEKTMHELINLARHTAELYHELNAFDRFEQDYRRKIQEMESLNLPRRGESLTIFQSELKHQKKLVRSLQKKSLWSINLEEIVEKLVDIVAYIHQAIFESFGNNGITPFGAEPTKGPQRLGVAGLALHYANVINHINNIASRPTSLPPNTRDILYQGLPNYVKKALPSRLQATDVKKEFSISQVKADLDKTLEWLLPLATNTIKAHQGFGWIGEWAAASSDFGNDTTTQNNLIRLQTLYYADKHKTDLYILDLVTWLHILINFVRSRHHSLNSLPRQSPPVFQPKMQQLLDCSTKPDGPQLSEEDRNLLEEINGKRGVPGISKSQDFAIAKRRGVRVCALSKSSGNSPSRELGTGQRMKLQKSNCLDIMDGLGC